MKQKQPGEVYSSCLTEQVWAKGQEPTSVQYATTLGTSRKLYFQGNFSTKQWQRMLASISLPWEWRETVLRCLRRAHFLRGCTVGLHCCPGGKNLLHQKAGTSEICGKGEKPRSMSIGSAQLTAFLCTSLALLFCFTELHSDTIELTPPLTHIVM